MSNPTPQDLITRIETIMKQAAARLAETKDDAAFAVEYAELNAIRETLKENHNVLMNLTNINENLYTKLAGDVLSELQLFNAIVDAMETYKARKFKD